MTPTTESYVYFVQAVVGGPVKIGVARDPSKRLREIQTGHPYQLVLRNSLPGDRTEESALHRYFRVYRMKGEWFDPIPELLDLLEATEWPVWLVDIRRKADEALTDDPRARLRAEQQATRRFGDVMAQARRYHRERAARGLRSTPK